MARSDSAHSRGVAVDMDGGVEFVIDTLDALFKLMTCCLVPTFIIEQVLGEVFRYFGECLFNSFISSHYYFRQSVGLQIQVNLESMRVWSSSTGLQASFLMHTTLIRQAAFLLEVDKSDVKALDMIGEFCTSLNSSQLDEILRHYTCDGDTSERTVSMTLCDCLRARAMNTTDLDCADDEAYRYRVQLTRTTTVVPFRLFPRTNRAKQHGLVSQSIMSLIYFNSTISL